MTTDELIARAEASLEGVTPGPWYTEMDGFGGHKVGSFGHETYDGTSAHCFIQQNFRDGRKAEKNNARFIAASRQLVPDLIAALRAERETRERAEALVAAAYRDAANIAREFDHPAIASVSGDTTAMQIAERILACTPADASAALDRIRQEAEDEAVLMHASRIISALKGGAK